MIGRMQLLSLFPECSIAITTKEDGGIVSVNQLQDLLEERSIKPRTVVLPSHSHATHICEVTFPLSAENKEINADGLITDEKQVVLAHRVADCCPIVILDRRKRILVTLHAGWRGMTQGIVGMGLLTLQAKGRSNLNDIWVWIGPCIQKDSYLSSQVPLQTQLASWKNHIHVRDDGFHVDLPGYAFDEVMKLGVSADHIISDGRDTFLERDAFFSHSRAVIEQNVTDDQRFVIAAWLV